MSYSSEQPLQPRDATRYVESRSGKRLSVQAIYRWMNKGLRGQRLGFRYIGGHRYTTPSLIEEFFDAVTAAARSTQVDEPPSDSCSPRAIAGRQVSIERAETELEQDGI